MRAVVMTAVGGPEVLTLSDVPMPSAGPGQVLVRTEAIGVSAGEARMRSGVYPMPVPPPVVFGAEAAGVVEAVGDGVDPELVGVRVTFVTGGVGSYAEYVAVAAANLVRVPDGMSAIDAVASTAAGAVAFALLHKAQVAAGETVLVEGGSGKVGGYLVRHARERGARVVATASRPAGVTADVVLDHGNPDWPDDLPAIDVAFELVGGATAGRVLESLTPSTGRMYVYGSLSGAPPVVDGTTVFRRGVQVAGCAGPGWFQQVLGVHSVEFLAAAAAGRTHLQPVEAVLPLSEAAEAHRRIGTGRIVLVP